MYTHRGGSLVFNDGIWDDIIIAMQEACFGKNDVSRFPCCLDGAHAAVHVILQCHVGEWAALIGVFKWLHARLPDGRLVHPVPRGPRGKLTAGNKARKMTRRSRKRMLFLKETKGGEYMSVGHVYTPPQTIMIAYSSIQ